MRQLHRHEACQKNCWIELADQTFEDGDLLGHRAQWRHVSIADSGQGNEAEIGHLLEEPIGHGLDVGAPVESFECKGVWVDQGDERIDDPQYQPDEQIDRHRPFDAAPRNPSSGKYSSQDPDAGEHEEHHGDGAAR